MKNKQIVAVVILGVFAILGIIFMQIYWLSKAYDVKERQFNETIHTALRNVAEKLADDNGGNLRNEDIVSQLSNDYYVVNLNDVIDASTLEYYLINEFEQFKIYLDFEYAIYDCTNDKMVYGNYVNLDERNSKKTPTHNLPTYDEYSYYFGLFLPTKSNFVINNLKLTLIFSVILLFALVFFAYAIYVILKQKRLSELQTDFINNMTHEFKTPISSIKLSAESMLKNEKIQQEVRLNKFTNIILEQSDRLNNQVEKVLNIAKLQNNELALNKELLNLNEILTHVVRSSELKVESKKGHIHLTLPEEVVMVQADKIHLNNILYNLIDNAVKYNDKTPKINLSLLSLNNSYIISISDNGIGIDEKYIKHVFNKFFRVPTGNVHNVKGFGIGLFYVKQVVKKHDWDISIESKLNKGTTIKITL